MGCGSSSDIQAYRKHDKSLWRGKLQIVLRKATIKKDFQLFGAMDPYVKITFGKQVKQSTTCTDGGQFPTWKNEVFEFTRTDEEDIVYIQVWNDGVLSDDFIGEGGFALTKVRKPTAGRIDTECEIYGNGEFVGSVQFEIDFLLEEECKNHPEVLAPDTTGTCIVRPKSAVLQNDVSGWFGTMSPILNIKLGDDSQVTAAHIDGGLNPKWSDQLVFTRDTIARDTFIVECQNFNESGKNDKVGVGWASITSILPLNSKVVKAVTLYNQGQITGNATIEFEFVSDNPEVYEQNNPQKQQQQQQQQQQQVQPQQQQPQQQQQQQQHQQQPQQQQIAVGGAPIPQQIQGPPQSGHAQYKYPNGAYYDGEWFNGLRHGKGKFMFQTGGVVVSYDGEFQMDKYHGHGKLIQGNFQYEGEFQQGLKQGHGVATWTGTLQKYNGSWLNNVYHGEGEWTDQQGSTKKMLFEFGQSVRVLEDPQNPNFSSSGQFKNFLGPNKILQQNQRLSSDNGQYFLTITGAGEIRLYDGRDIIWEIEDFGDDDEEQERIDQRQSEIDDEMRKLEREKKKKEKKERNEKRKKKSKGILDKGKDVLNKLTGKDREDEKEKKRKERKEKQKEKIRSKQLKQLKKESKQLEKDRKQIEDDEFEAPFSLKLNPNGELVAQYGKKKNVYWSSFDDEGCYIDGKPQGVKLVVRDSGDICIVDKDGVDLIVLNE